jgi:hypothetical protein
VYETIKFRGYGDYEILASDYDVAKSTLTIPHPYPKGSAKHFIESILEAEKVGRVVICAMIEKLNTAWPEQTQINKVTFLVCLGFFCLVLLSCI